MKRSPGLFFITTLLACSVIAGQDNAGKNTDSRQQQKPDNTGVNKRDRDSGALTAGKQTNNPADRRLVRQIRRDIVKDKSLSTYAHNVKIITENGAVTLRGPVRSE